VFTSLASACAFISLFFRDVSTLMFLHFFNHKECQSLSLHTKMQSIQSTVVVEVRKFSLSFSLSFKLSFKLLSSKAFCFVSRALLPSPASFFLWKVALRDDDFCDSIFGYLFGSIPRETFRGVVLFTLISLFSLSLTRAFPRQTCANEHKQTAIFVQALVRGVFSQNVRAEENLVEHPQRGE